MELGNLIITPAAAFAGSALLAAIGLVIWWLVRKRQKRIWLPTVRVMRLETRVLPRLVLRLPPLVSFICFLIVALMMVAFAMKPRTQIFTPFEPNQTRVHVFADMSPSVAAHKDLDSYTKYIGELWSSLEGSGRISFSTSHAPTIYEPKTKAELEEIVKRLGFHRAGLKLGPAMKGLLEELGAADRLFIVSDHDSHSWSGFNWQYLLDEMEVRLVDVEALGSTQLSNTFFSELRYLSAPSSANMEWDVELGRRGRTDEASGTLTASYQGVVLGTFPFSFKAGRGRLSLRASWPLSSLENAKQAAAKTPKAAEMQDASIVWQIQIDGPDALDLDNTFRTAVIGLKQDVLIVSETQGERALEDPANQLSIALDVLGFRLRRQDYTRQSGPKAEDYPLWVLLGGTGLGADRFCPQTLMTPPAKASESAVMPKVWLAPIDLEANYAEMCVCYSRLIGAAQANESPDYCEHVTSRQHWLGLLPSLGAKQIGGEVGDERGSLAFHGKNRQSGLEVLAFTIPLMPLVATGINHAQMPVLIKELLQWHGLLEAQKTGRAGSWLRPDDIVEAAWHYYKKSKEVAKAGPRTQPEANPQLQRENALLLERLTTANIPLGESLMTPAELSALPPRYTAPSELAEQQLPTKKDREDPLPWLKVAAALVVMATGAEALFLLAAWLLRLLKRRPELLLLPLIVMASSRSEAKVALGVVGYERHALSFKGLARDVAHRTSIELAVVPEAFDVIDSAALQQPWLWVRDLSKITSPNGELKADLALWLKRGGFLVIEVPLVDAQLQQLAAKLGSNPRGEGRWEAIPPDHELMRSFYLLDSLPICNEQVWRGFQYDGRLAIVAVPYDFLATLKDSSAPAACPNALDGERSVRVFVNLVMVALATDYKKDQIHLPEILKRLR